MSKAIIHIGKKIKEVLDKTPLSVVDFAKKIKKRLWLCYQNGAIGHYTCFTEINKGR